MSLLGPPTAESSSKPWVCELPEPRHAHLEAILQWLPQLMADHGDEQKLQAGLEVVDALEAVAVWLLEQDRPEDALQVFKTAWHLHPHENRFKKGMAAAFTRAGDHQSAWVSWKALCDMSPNDAENQLMLAQALYCSGRRDAGRDAFNRWFATWLDLEDLPAGLKVSAMQWFRWLQSSD
jgi:predicted Zn-dependent protease